MFPHGFLTTSQDFVTLLAFGMAAMVLVARNQRHSTAFICTIFSNCISAESITAKLVIYDNDISIKPMAINRLINY